MELLLFIIILICIIKPNDFHRIALFLSRLLRLYRKWRKKINLFLLELEQRFPEEK